MTTLRLRYDAVCQICHQPIAAGTTAAWDRAAKKATCLSCDDTVSAGGPVEAPAAGATTVEIEHPSAAPEAVAALDVGVAGGSARRIADRQQAKRDAAKAKEAASVRAAHPRAGNLILKARDMFCEPEKPTSWQKGAAGEESAGRTFQRLVEDGFQVLHDRRKPGTKWNIDHVVVGPRGVYVIDAKHYSGRLEVRSTGNFFRPGPNRVFVKGRARDKRVTAMDWQVEWIREAAGDLIDQYGGVIRPVLCFMGVETDLFQKPQLVGANDVLVTWPRRFVKDVGRDGSLNAAQIDEVAQRIAVALPAAVAKT